jgi:uncharacterized protein (DUF305 family)
METKSLAYAVVGFLLGGLVVSVAATQFNKSEDSNGSMTMSQMSEDLKGKTGDDFDQAFISGMIGHHQGAINMANLAKENAKHDEIKKLADDILSAQSKEIDMMQTWQTDWGYKSTPQSHDTMSH